MAGVRCGGGCGLCKGTPSYSPGSYVQERIVHGYAGSIAFDATSTADIEILGVLWQSSGCLPNSSLSFSRPLLQSIVNKEAKLRAVLSGEHSLTRSEMVKELRATQLTLNESLQIAMHDLPVDKTSHSTTGQGHLSGGVSQESNLDKNTSSERPETGPAVSELSLKGADDIETVQSQLGSAVETFERLGSMIQASTKVSITFTSSHFRANIRRT